MGNIHARREQWADAIATYKHAIEVEVSSQHHNRHPRSRAFVTCFDLGFYKLFLFVQPTALAYLQLAKAYKGKGTPSRYAPPTFLVVRAIE